MKAADLKKPALWLCTAALLAGLLSGRGTKPAPQGNSTQGSAAGGGPAICANGRHADGT
ncbi:hypothetical protein LJK87_08655 [Paenibacillus sp. P25]|nr:hypothetical protein LJK87_08655 [Paenibacillus sp. P25]